MTHETDYATLSTKLKVVTDRIAAVAHHFKNGFYLYGRPGTSKTYTVKQTLDELDVEYLYQSGRITPLGLFQVIEANPDILIVLDDVATAFRNETAQEILLAATGNQPSGREISYRTARSVQKTIFRGGIIAISNLSLHRRGDDLIEALNDRFHVVRYEPTDAELIGLLHHLADQGQGDISSQDCHIVLEFLLAECKKRTISPSIRLFVDKALKDFQMHREGLCELDWKDLIVSDLEQQMILPAHPVNNLRRSERIAEERTLAQDIYRQYATRAERTAAWEKQAKKSEKSFYRRLGKVGPSDAELDSEPSLSDVAGVAS